MERATTTTSTPQAVQATTIPPAGWKEFMRGGRTVSSFVKGRPLYKKEELDSKFLLVRGRTRFTAEVGLREADWFFGTAVTGGKQ